MLALAAWAAATVGVAAQSYVTLQRAVAMATRHDARIIEAEAKEDRAVREAAVAHAHFGPNVFTGTGGVYTYGYPQIAGGGPPSVLNVAFTQAIYDGPAKGRQHAAEERVQVQKLSTALVRNQVIVDTACAYLELAAVRQILERQRRARESAQRIVELTIEQLRAARVLQSDVMQARVSSARLAQRIAQLESREGVLEGELLVLTGLPAGGVFEISLETLPSLPDRSIDELIAAAVENNPDLKAGEVERRARVDNLAGQRGGRWPSIDLIGNYAMFSRLNNLDVFLTRFQRNNINVGLEARVPLFSSETSAAVALARSEVAEADVALRRQRDQLELDVRRAAGKTREAVAGRDVAEAELALAQEGVRVAQERVAEGRAGQLDVDKALVEEGHAWDSFYQAEFERQRAQLALRQITGELNRLFP